MNLAKQSAQGARRDLFAEARAAYNIPGAWAMLQLPGEPNARCRSPFREDRNPSFSIFDNGRAWKDHATGEGGDLIEFIRTALGCDYSGVRDYLCGRLGINRGPRSHKPVVPRATKTPPPQREIEWPAEVSEGSPEKWQAFARARGMTYPATRGGVKSGFLRFTVINGSDCFVVTDNERRAAEIRRIDRGLFGHLKAYPLKGVDKSWLPGAALLRGASEATSVLLAEGATDALAAMTLYTRYRRKHGGAFSWVPLALLGASCRNIDPTCAALIGGRHVRLVPDADPAGEKMRVHWTGLLRTIGCSVDSVTLPDGYDLNGVKALINPKELFDR